MTREDDEKVKKGQVDADILMKLAQENNRRLLLLDPKYGGRKLRRGMRAWK